MFAWPPYVLAFCTSSNSSSPAATARALSTKVQGPWWDLVCEGLFKSMSRRGDSAYGLAACHVRCNKPQGIASEWLPRWQMSSWG